MGGGTANLPPGFRFFPSDEELVVHFLYRKAPVLHCEPGVIPNIDLHECNPWRKQNRADKIITCSNKDAVKKTRRYYIGQPPEGIETTRWMAFSVLVLVEEAQAAPVAEGRDDDQYELYRWVIRRVHESTSDSLASFRGSKRYSG
ncbi:Nac domain-containing protein [Musa troglodytarum]|uniref:Nac domain-containing protein n=1 Tax=Musa troglodytarum TaxID=320322 RepID=A0A9E7JVU1_9LILI|nr:Nac domain-containing protein [Musa troglodytarum]